MKEFQVAFTQAEIEDIVVGYVREKLGLSSKPKVSFKIIRNAEAEKKVPAKKVFKLGRNVWTRQDELAFKNYYIPGPRSRTASKSNRRLAKLLGRTTNALHQHQYALKNA